MHTEQASQKGVRITVILIDCLCVDCLATECQHQAVKFTKWWQYRKKPPKKTDALLVSFAYSLLCIPSKNYSISTFWMSRMLRSYNICTLIHKCSVCVSSYVAGKLDRNFHDWWWWNITVTIIPFTDLILMIYAKCFPLPLHECEDIIPSRKRNLEKFKVAI